MQANIEKKVHPSLLKRKIIHIDLDAFFAAVEIRDNPRLKGKPIIIGGMPGSRGVVATASYEARKFGIHSAMASSHAKKLCPQAIFLPPRFEAYKDSSKDVFKILAKYTTQIEPMSLDEAYLDVTQNPNHISATQMAEEIRKEIFTKTKLTASAGIAPNKMVAKIASDINKPNGITVIKPQFVFNFMQPLLLKKIPFVGPVTAKKFAALNLMTCADVVSAGKDFIINHFGKSSEWVYERACGIDESEIITTHIRKSLGEEETFLKDLTKEKEKTVGLKKIICNLFHEINKKNIAVKTVTVKIKYSNFVVRTKSKSFPLYFYDKNTIEKIALNLLNEFNDKNTPIRLLGASVSNIIDREKMEQYTLFNDYI